MPLRTLTTVLSPALSPDLVDLDAVKNELKIAASDTEHDAFLGRAIGQVSTAIAGYCNRTFSVETVRDTIFVGLGGAQLQLSRFPVIAVTAATVTDGTGGQTLLAEGMDYLLDAPRGWLLRLGTGGVPVAWYITPTTVTYQAGYQDIPADLQQAALRLIAARFHNRGRDPTLRSQSQPGLGDQTYWIGSVPGSHGPFPEEVLVILDAYRVPVGP
jgi:hypothetical protein